MVQHSPAATAPCGPLYAGHGAWNAPAAWLQNFLDIDKRARHAFAHLTKLHTLQISDPTSRTLKLLKKMQVLLESIDATFTHRVDPVPVFARFKDSLRTMSLTYVESASTKVQYPHVVSVSADLCASMEVEPLVRCFPNLQDLGMHISQEEEDMEDNEIEEIPLSNLASQARGTWPLLHQLSGTPLELYMLGIRCRVDQVNATCEILSLIVDGRRLGAVLADVRPTSLSI